MLVMQVNISHVVRHEILATLKENIPGFEPTRSSTNRYGAAPKTNRMGTFAKTSTIHESEEVKGDDESIGHAGIDINCVSISGDHDDLNEQGSGGQTELSHRSSENTPVLVTTDSGSNCDAEPSQNSTKNMPPVLKALGRTDSSSNKCNTKSPQSLAEESASSRRSEVNNLNISQAFDIESSRKSNKCSSDEALANVFEAANAEILDLMERDSFRAWRRDYASRASRA